jgi:hypothetical protein
MSYWVAYLITVQHPMRFPLQAVVSLGQIYGDVLYYATSMFDHYYKNLTYCRPEAYYFWFYFFFMNFIWIVIPGCTYRLPAYSEITLTTLSATLPEHYNHSPRLQGANPNRKVLTRQWSGQETSGERPCQKECINVSRQSNTRGGCGEPREDSMQAILILPGLDVAPHQGSCLRR